MLTQRMNPASRMRNVDVNWRTVPVAVFVVLVSCIAAFSQAAIHDDNEQPQPSSLPAWLTPGTIRFARFDGGPIEVQKASRAAWGSRFTRQDFDALANLYGSNGDRMVDLLQQARINFVWVTYSVGFSEKDEAEQRAAVREIVKKLHARGIKAAAYVCAISMFWESMFKDVPQSVKWLMFDSKGFPYRYSDGADALRFIADLDNPDWVNYQKRRVGNIVDDGLDAIFFDNTNIDYHANSEESVSRFLAEIVGYTRNEKKSDIPLFTNLGLGAQFIHLNRYMDVVYAESWVEPGVWEGQWDVSNVRRNRLLKGVNGSDKPFVTEYSLFHKGDRNDSFLSARSQKLGIAEAAAFGAAYTWDMEGPFDTALARQESKAVESWSAIARYNEFLADHVSLYAGAVNAAPWLVLLPEGLDPDFGWAGNVPRLDLLTRASVLCDYRLANAVSKTELSAYEGIIVPAYSALSAEQRGLLRGYQAGGGKVFAFSETASAMGLTGEILPVKENALNSGNNPADQVVSQLAALAPSATRIDLANKAGHVIANLTTTQHGKAVAVHLLNYDPERSQEVKLKLVLGKGLEKFAGKRPSVISPDSTGSTPLKMQWKGTTLEVTLPPIDTYSVLLLQ